MKETPANLKTILPLSAGFLTFLAVSSAFLRPPKGSWKWEVLEVAAQILVSVDAPRFSMLPALTVGAVAGVIAAIAGAVLAAKLEILAASWASAKSSKALRGTGDGDSVEDQTRWLIKKLGRR